MSHQPGGFRHAYTTHGVDKYYQSTGTSYRNPHFPGVVKCIHTILDRLAPDIAKYGALTVFDLAAGSGEATVAVRSWVRRVRLELLEEVGEVGEVGEGGEGIDGISDAKSSGESISHPDINSLPQPSSTLHRRPKRTRLTIHASDPYTHLLYNEKVNSLPSPPPLPSSLSLPSHPPLPLPLYPLIHCHPFTFRDIPTVGLSNLLPLLPCSSKTQAPITLTLISFALHLVPQSELFSLLYELSLHSEYLVVVAPHKNPHIPGRGEWGWYGPLLGGEVVVKVERVRGRVFRSGRFGGGEEGEMEGDVGDGEEGKERVYRE